MFSKLTEFNAQRSIKEAVGFYLAYFILFLLLGFTVGGIIGVLNPDQAYEVGVKVGQIMAVIMCCALAVTIVFKKSLQSSFKCIALAVMAALLSILLGALGGLIPIAYLTTVPDGNA
ncbi:hypothetical protein R50073_11490 [Maricurvus nonylphenolicus]|uniref:hypothetical protein n=1 Tax=Maricurvus nonylphenolicus TaxID=1008307 RepID=UPI0036F2ADC9